MQIGNFKVGGEKCFIIAEIGQAHEGSFGTALSYIDAVAETGVDAIKFQTHIASEESTRHEKFRVNIFPEDKSRYDYWKRMEFSEQQWRQLANYAKSKKLIFLSSPFSLKAVELLEDLNVPAYKIGSGDINNDQLIDSIIKKRRPVLVSSGMSDHKETNNLIKKLKKSKIPCGLFQCTTSYPCKAEDVGYNVIEEYKTKHNIPIGLSDHSGSIYPSLAAVAIGAKMLEVHAVFSKDCFGPDSSSSLTMNQLSQLVEGVRFIEKGINNKIDKDSIVKNLSATKKLFSRSAFFTKEIQKGEVFKLNNFAMKKPGGGLCFNEAKKLLGKKISKNRKLDDYVKKEDFE